MPPSLAAVLAPLCGCVSVELARHSTTHSLRTHFAWVTVRISKDVDATVVRDALTLLVTALQHTNGRKSEWKTIFALLHLNNLDMWDEIQARDEVQVHIRLFLASNFAHNRILRLRTVLGLEDDSEHEMEEVTQLFRTMRRQRGEKIRLRLALETSQASDQHPRDLTDLLSLVSELKQVTRWELHALELSEVPLELDSQILSLLESLSHNIPLIATLSIRLPLMSTVAHVTSALQRIDHCSNISELTIIFGNGGHLPPIVDAVTDMSHVRYVRLVRWMSRRHHHQLIEDVDLTAFFRPSTTTSPMPAIRCADWTLNPVQVATWFLSPLRHHQRSRVMSLDLELDAMTLWTLVAALDYIGSTLQRLTVRSKWRSAAQPPELLPLDNFLLDCPQLEMLEVHGFRIASLSSIVGRYGAKETQVQSLAFRQSHFDDELTPGLMTIMHALADSRNPMTLYLRELLVDPVESLSEVDINAIVRMLHCNTTLELLVLQNDGKPIPALWNRIHVLHLASSPTFYAFLSAARRRSDGFECETTIQRLTCDILTIILRFVGQPRRRKLLQH